MKKQNELVASPSSSPRLTAASATENASASRAATAGAALRDAAGIVTVPARKKTLAVVTPDHAEKDAIIVSAAGDGMPMLTADATVTAPDTNVVVTAAAPKPDSTVISGSSGRSDMDEALVFDVCTDRQACATTGAPDDAIKQPAQKNGISGVDDRVHYLAMAAVGCMPVLRPPKLGKASSLRNVTPKSRAECERRCGADGFCDASSKLGCGGMYCGKRYDRV